MPGFDLGSIRSVRSNTINIGGPDPIQGHDVGVWVEDLGRKGRPNILLGQFTSITIMVKNATEPYRPVGSRQAIYFDGDRHLARARVLLHPVPPSPAGPAGA